MAYSLQENSGHINRHYSMSEGGGYGNYGGGGGSGGQVVSDYFPKPNSNASPGHASSKFIKKFISHNAQSQVMGGGQMGRYQDYGGSYGGGFNQQQNFGGNFQLGVKRKSAYGDYGGCPKKTFGAQRDQEIIQENIDRLCQLMLQQSPLFRGSTGYDEMYSESTSIVIPSSQESQWRFPAHSDSSSSSSMLSLPMTSSVKDLSTTAATCSRCPPLFSVQSSPPAPTFPTENLSRPRISLPPVCQSGLPPAASSKSDHLSQQLNHPSTQQSLWTPLPLPSNSTDQVQIPTRSNVSHTRFHSELQQLRSPLRQCDSLNPFDWSLNNHETENPSGTNVDAYSSYQQWKKNGLIKGTICCNYCKNNREMKVLYTSHKTYEHGVVTCPVLRRYVCPICGATGDVAHTASYCPVKPRESMAALSKTKRQSCGCKRHN